MTPEQIWMRDPSVQSVEESQFYEEIFEFVMEDIQKISTQNGIIAEGAAFIPKLMNRCNVDSKRYINMTPTPEFQISHYKERSWVPYALEGCSDKEIAFKNWMDRDILFAREVRKQCEKMGYNSFINDGGITINELVKRVSLQFGLEY